MFADPLAHCRLSITRSESALAQPVSAAQISTCYLDLPTIGEHGDGLWSNSRLNEILDGTARPVGASDIPRQKMDEGIAEDLQVSRASHLLGQD